MKRVHLIEIADEDWCPRSIRHAVTDYCRFVTEQGLYPGGAAFGSGAPEDSALATCSTSVPGRRGPWLRLQPLLARNGR